jgi:hypothetical protein
MRGCELIPVSRALAHTHTLHGFVCPAGINRIRVPVDNATIGLQPLFSHSRHSVLPTIEP